MTYLKKLAKGFTLIELMIVVAIIGILAAIAIPNFVKFQCRSKQSEAKGNLKALYVAMESYRAEYDTYTSSECGAACDGANPVGFAPKGGKIRYTYNQTSGDTTAFTATATVKSAFVGELSDDAWQITQANDVANSANGCQ
jgi:type IV pilus assembly protein PilA